MNQILFLSQSSHNGNCYSLLLHLFSQLPCNYSDPKEADFGLFEAVFEFCATVNQMPGRNGK